jgi:hypothetical protein
VKGKIVQNENTVQPPTKKALELRQVAGIFIIIAVALSFAIPIINGLPFIHSIFDIYEVYRITWIACYSMYIIAGVMIVVSKWKVGFDKIAGLLIMLAGVAYVVMEALYMIEHEMYIIFGNYELRVVFDVAEDICGLAFSVLLLASGILFLARVETPKTKNVGILTVVSGSILIAYNIITFIHYYLGIPSIFTFVFVIIGLGVYAAYVLLIVAGVMLILDSPKRMK